VAQRVAMSASLRFLTAARSTALANCCRSRSPRNLPVSRHWRGDRRQAIPWRHPVLSQRTSAARPNPSGQWPPAPRATHPDPQRRDTVPRGQASRSSIGARRAHRRGIGRAVRARACSIAASRNTSNLARPMPRQSRRRVVGAGICGAWVSPLPRLRHPNGAAAWRPLRASSRSPI